MADLCFWCESGFDARGDLWDGSLYSSILVCRTSDYFHERKDVCFETRPFECRESVEWVPESWDAGTCRNGRRERFEQEPGTMTKMWQRLRCEIDKVKKAGPGRRPRSRGKSGGCPSVCCGRCRRLRFEPTEDVAFLCTHCGVEQIWCSAAPRAQLPIMGRSEEGTINRPHSEHMRQKRQTHWRKLNLFFIALA